MCEEDTACTVALFSGSPPGCQLLGTPYPAPVYRVRREGVHFKGFQCEAEPSLYVQSGEIAVWPARHGPIPTVPTPNVADIHGPYYGGGGW